MSNITDTKLESQKINRFNGQYLKCVVTNYESTMTILKNSGTLIVHRPLDEDYNYLYLGNEFLSSGYGQKDIATRDDLAYIANSYNDIVSYMLNSYSYSLNYIENDYNALLEKLEDYVEIDGGNISYTTIVYPLNGGSKYNVSDIVLNGQEAEYEDLSINSVLKYVNNKPYEQMLVMPVGDQIFSVDFIVSSTRNDSGGIKEISFNYNLMQQISNNDVARGSNIKAYSSNAMSNAIESTINCTLLYDKNMYYFIKEGKNDIVNNVYVTVAQTPKALYKNYPKLEKNGIEIPSTFNALEDHTIELDGISIVGKHTISLIASANPSTIPNEAAILAEESSLKPSDYYIGTPDNRYNVMRQFIDNDVCFDIEANTYMISFVVPNKWKAYEVYFIEGRTKIVHNWTGAVRAQYSTTSQDSDLVQIGKMRYVHCDKYTIIMSTATNEAGTLLIRTYDTGKEQDILHSPGTDEFRYYTDIYDLLYNEEFTSIYWLNYNAFTDGTFNNVIEKLRYNGTKTF